MPEPAEIRLFNTLTRTTAPFAPLEPGNVRLYTCGPTVYNYAHIGNLRTYVLEDLVRRVFEASGWEVNHVMNVTDVGHLESDADEGEDKMALASAREKKSPWDIARFYEDAFFEDTDKLRILRPTVVCRATDHIDDMIAFVKGIEDNGFTYTVEGNVYFAVERFEGYGKMANLDLERDHLARVEADPRKKNPRDFVLWFSQSKFPHQIMQWDSPWGRGFPGWHIECSAMASKYLGERIDIHMGGIDHIPVHHTNEIAQAEARYGHEWVNVWMHCEFLVIDKEKMSKSAGEFLRLKTLEDRGFEAVHYRYFCLGAHYRSQLTFNWDALDGARRAYESLKNRVVSWKVEAKKLKGELRPEARAYAERFWSFVRDDFNVPRALGVVWDMARDTGLKPEEKLALVQDFDRVLGLGVEGFEKPELPPELMARVRAREEARAAKDWATADAIRAELLEAGVQLKDTPDGTGWYFTVDELDA